MTLKITQGQQNCRHLVNITSYLWYVVTTSMSCTASEILSVISQNLHRSRDPDPAPITRGLPSVG